MCISEEARQKVAFIYNGFRSPIPFELDRFLEIVSQRNLPVVICPSMKFFYPPPSHYDLLNPVPVGWSKEVSVQPSVLLQSRIEDGRRIVCDLNLGSKKGIKAQGSTDQQIEDRSILTALTLAENLRSSRISTSVRDPITGEPFTPENLQGLLKRQEQGNLQAYPFSLPEQSSRR